MTVKHKTFTVHSTVNSTPSEYFLGGRQKASKQIYVYDPWNNTWQHVTDMEKSRWGHAVSVLPDIWQFCHN